jgi:AraC-like DNA-binding protein/ligand-binding sensor protein
MAKQSKACAACLITQHELATTAQEHPRTVECFAGLCETAVPLRVGDKLIGFLRTGEVLLRRPNQRQFAGIVRQLAEWAAKVDVAQVREAYFRTRVLSQKQYDSTLQLLRIFAQHLSMVANQVVFRSEHAEPANITRAREFIAQHHADDLCLETVAKAVHMSTFYFCKQFKKATGLSFTDYLGRLRVEKAKEMLLNPQARVSEVAFDAGFQSITHFNRIFKKHTGQSPTEYRETLAHAA